MDSLSTDDLLHALNSDPEAPWAEWGRGGLTARGLSGGGQEEGPHVGAGGEGCPAQEDQRADAVGDEPADATKDISPVEPATVGQAPPAEPKAVARRGRTVRPPGASMEQLLAVARPAVHEHGLAVAVVQQAIRAADLPIGSARFTQLMNLLRAEHAEPAHRQHPQKRADVPRH